MAGVGVNNRGPLLNPGQEAAGRILLAGNDRIVTVQGAAAAGKSSALGQVVEREEGREGLAGKVDPDGEAGEIRSGPPRHVR